MRKEFANLLRALANRLSPTEEINVGNLVNFTDTLADTLNKTICYASYLAECLDAVVGRVIDLDGKPWEDIPVEKKGKDAVANDYITYLKDNINI